MKTTCLAVAISLLTMLHSARAEELPQPVVVVSHVLQLSDAQREALVAMIRAREAALRPIAERIESNRQALAALLESPSPDPAEVGQLLIETRQLERHAAEAARQAAETFAATLSDEQRERMGWIAAAAQVAPAVPAFQAVGLL